MVGLLALFGRRIGPAILVELHTDPEGVPSTSPQADHTNAPLVTPQERLGNVLSVDTQNLTLVPPTATQKDLPNIPSAPPQDGLTDALHPERDDDAANPPFANPRQQHWIMPEAYEVW